MQYLENFVLENKKKKKILIFSSRGGGGHTAVANALEGYLNDEYEIVIANIFTDALAPLDLLETITFDRCTGEDLYNFFITRKWYGAINTYYKVGAWYYNTWNNKNVRSLIRACIEKHQPDMVISVIVIVNQSILQVTQEMDLPFLLIPTDLDIATFLEQIKSPSYNKFKIALPFDEPEAYIRLAQAQATIDCATVTGFTIRPDFFETKDKVIIKKQYGVPEDKPVILLLLGAVGLQSLYEFTQELGKITQSAHLIICTGRQDIIKQKIDRLQLPAHITKTTVGFTNRMSDLMSIADVFITKSGSVSVCEALYMEVPIILDATTKLLAWEKANHRFIQLHKCGTILRNQNELAPLIDSLLTNPEQLALYKKNHQAIEKKHGGSEIKKLIWQMFNF